LYWELLFNTESWTFTRPPRRVCSENLKKIDSSSDKFANCKKLLGIASWMATLQNRRSCFFVQGQMCPHSGFTDRHLHAQIEQLRVSVLHFVLAEEGAHHFFACRLEGDAEGLVLDVGAQTFRINFDGRLEENKIMVTKMKKKKFRYRESNPSLLGESQVS
jgi:hypothetical protein